MPQDTVLFNDTLGYNIGYGDITGTPIMLIGTTVALLSFEYTLILLFCIALYCIIICSIVFYCIIIQLLIDIDVMN